MHFEVAEPFGMISISFHNFDLTTIEDILQFPCKFPITMQFNALKRIFSALVYFWMFRLQRLYFIHEVRLWPTICESNFGVTRGLRGRNKALLDSFKHLKRSKYTLSVRNTHWKYSKWRWIALKLKYNIKLMRKNKHSILPQDIPRTWIIGSWGWAKIRPYYIFLVRSAESTWSSALSSHAVCNYCVVFRRWWKRNGPVKA